MSLPPNSELTLMDYQITDLGLDLRFVCFVPGPGQATDYSIVLTDADLVGVATQAQLRSLVISRLQRKLRATALTAKIDPFVGQTVTI